MRFTNSPRPQPDATSRPTATILLVEDHADTARTMHKMLTQWGYAVLTAHTILHHRPVDLVIFDCGLPDGCGLD